MNGVSLGITAEQCKQAFSAGDMAYYNANNCAQSQANTALVVNKKSELSTKTFVIIGAAVVALGLIFFLTRSKSS